MRFKHLEQYRTGGTNSRMHLGIPLPKTPDGRVYRYSPNEKALPRYFVLGEIQQKIPLTDETRKRMKITPGSPQTVCPYSGVVASDQDFTHPDDVRAALEMVKHAAAEDARAAFTGMFKSLEQNFSGSKFVQVKTTSAPVPKPKPRFARWDLLRELICDHCGRDYGVFAIALFCPDCGAPNVHLHFARETRLISEQVQLAESRQDDDELAYRLMGNAHEDVLTAFEATLKCVYLYGASQLCTGSHEIKPARNDFQNVKRAQGRFAELNFDPFWGLPDVEMTVLKLNIQKRHVIGHNLSVVDEKFADYDSGERIGETVHLIGEDIREFARVAQRIVNHLDAWLAGGIAPPPALEQEISTTVTTPVTGTEDLPPFGLSSLATEVGKWIAARSTSGLSNFVDTGALQKAFEGRTTKEIATAIAELTTDGYLMANQTMGSVLPHIRPTTDLFVTFDPLSKVGDPISDSATLIQRVLAGDDSVDIARLHGHTDWPARRFNPAIALVLAQIDGRRISQAIQNEYPAAYFRLNVEDRVALQRCAAQITKARS